MRIWKCLTLAGTLAACSAQDANEPQIYELAYKWSMLRDGSSYTLDQSRDFMRQAWRCWPDGRAFDCVRVTQIDQLPTSFLRQRMPKLPSPSFVDEAPGYSCFYSRQHGMFTEEIRGRGALLTSNAVLGISDNKPWTRDWAERYMRENDAQGSLYFNCRALADAINAGSPATLGTTTIEHSDLTS